jgi:hypothetical protein
MLGMHLKLPLEEGSSFEPQDGLPRALNLPPKVLQFVRSCQTTAFACTGDLQTVRPNKLNTYMRAS